MSPRLVQLTVPLAALALGCTSTESADAPEASARSAGRQSTRALRTQAYDTTPPASATLVVDDVSGTAYRVWVDPDGDIYGHDDVPSAERAARSSDHDTFFGTARKTAKIDVAEAPVEDFTSIDTFLATLPSDGQMQAMNISNGATSERIDLENRNVRIPCFILASNRPDDNDYHVIVGNHAEAPTQLMNVEVSGLPEFPRDDDFTTQADAQVLTSVRNFYKTRMGDRLPSSSYKRYSPGIPVVVTGSVFYDTSHTPGQVGPSGLRPDTSWELHPISFLNFDAEVTTPSIKDQLLERVGSIELEVEALRTLVEGLE